MQTAGAGSALVLSGLQSAGSDAASRKPNIVLITTDQQHWRALGFADNFFDTPNLDALAATGVVFSQAYCTTPQCSASRSSIYTGLYPHKTTVIGNIGSIRHDGKPIEGLPPGTETAGSRLRTAGYHTAYFGKWHLGRKQHFANQFDIAHLNGNGRDGATEKAVEYLKERAGTPEKPFALFVNYINPHDIYQYGFFEKPDKVDPPGIDVPHPESWCESFEDKPAPQKRFMTHDQGKYFVGKPDLYWEKYREVYRAKCKRVDHQAGRVLKTLDDTRLSENTIVLFCSDHGDMDTHHRLVYKGPFMYEHMVRVPLIIRVPGMFGGIAPCEVGQFAVLADITPTLCDLAGIENGDLDGLSLAPFLEGRGPMPHREFVVSQYYNKQKWVNPIRMLRTREFKYNRYIEQGEELYDLENDPHELANLANDPGYADTKRELAHTLANWMQTNGDTAFESYRTTDLDGKPRQVPT